MQRIRRRNCRTVRTATSAPASSPSITLSIRPPGTAPQNAVGRSRPPRRSAQKHDRCAAGMKTQRASRLGHQPPESPRMSGVKAAPMATPITGTNPMRRLRGTSGRICANIAAPPTARTLPRSHGSGAPTVNAARPPARPRAKAQPKRAVSARPGACRGRRSRPTNAAAACRQAEPASPPAALPRAPSGVRHGG